MIKSFGYELIRQFPSENTSCDVYLVEKDGRKYIFKSARPNDFLSLSHVRREHELLTELKEVRGIPEELEFHEGNPFFLVRTYVEGSNVDRWNKVKGNENLGIISEIVRNLHKRGYVGADLGWSGNVILDSEGAPWVVDLGNPKKMNDVPRINTSDFRNLIEGDLSDLRLICSV